MAGVAERRAGSITAYLELVFAEVKKASGLLCYRGQTGIKGTGSLIEIRGLEIRGQVHLIEQVDLTAEKVSKNGIRFTYRSGKLT